MWITQLCEGICYAQHGLMCSPLWLGKERFFLSQDHLYEICF